MQAAPIRIELPTGLPVGTVNAYLFTEPEPVLVDTGLKSAESLAALQEGLAKHDLATADLARVIVSHHHVDHFGLAATITRAGNAEIWVLESTFAWLVDFEDKWRERLAYYSDYLLGSFGLAPEASEPILKYMATVQDVCETVPAKRVKTFTTEDQLSMGGANWQVLHTPGHASTLTCFYQPDFHHFLSTDMLLALTPTPIVERPVDGTHRRGKPLLQYLASLERVEALEIEKVFPGHGDPFTEHRELIRHQRERIQNRKEECLQHLRKGFKTLGELLPIMYAHYPPAFRFAGLWMIVGYIDLLESEGKVFAEEKDGVWSYHAYRD